MVTTLIKTEVSNSIIGEVTRLPERVTKIAELAYCKAEQRGFAPGHELDDWLLAEREIMLGESSESYAHKNNETPP